MLRIGNAAALSHNVEMGNPPDAPQLTPAVERITGRTGRAARAVTADRGYVEASVENALLELGVRSVAVSCKGKLSGARREVEHHRAVRDKVKWRTGFEGRINHINRSYGWNRTQFTSLQGARTWCGHGVFAQNLVKIGHPRRMTSPRGSLRPADTRAPPLSSNHHSYFRSK